MGPLIDMQVGQVYSSGRAVSGMSGQAGAVARTFLTAVSDASGSVGHARVSSALTRYHDTWSNPAYRLAHDVDALGNNTAGSAVDVGTGDSDASHAAHAASTPNIALADRLNGGWGPGAGGGTAGAPATPGGQGRYSSIEAAEAGGYSPLA